MIKYNTGSVSNINSIKRFDERDTLVYKKISEVNEDGLPVKEVEVEIMPDQIEPEDQRVETIFRKSYKNGALVLETAERYGIKVFESKMESLENDQLIRYEVFNHELPYLEILEYQLDERELLIRESIWQDDELVFEKTNRYNSNDDVVETILQEQTTLGFVQITKLAYECAYYPETNQ